MDAEYQKVFDSNWNFQERLESQVLNILIQHFKLKLDKDKIEVSDQQTDMTKGIDIIITTQVPCETQFHIGCRIRKINQYEKYHDEFTIRYPSELTKICKRYLEYELYCFASETEILSYKIISLPTFLDTINQNPLLMANNTAIENSDGNNTTFYAFKYKDFPKHMILKEYTDTTTIESMTIKIKKEKQIHLLEIYNQMSICTA